MFKRATRITYAYPSQTPARNHKALRQRSNIDDRCQVSKRDHGNELAASEGHMCVNFISNKGNVQASRCFSNLHSQYESCQKDDLWHFIKQFQIILRLKDNSSNSSETPHLVQVLWRVNGSAWIVGVDDYPADRLCIHQRLHLAKVDLPRPLWLQVIVSGLNA